MAVTSKNFNELFTYTRGTGATRVNSAGLIVGVDFSSTSNTIATGSKTFTLTADANVNRDWHVGSSVIAVSQAGAVGSMTGTVTSYTPSTQVLVLSIASVTGSGTSTNWRIGSLEFRRDFDPVTLSPKGGLVEGGSSELIRQNLRVSLSPWVSANSIASQNASLSPSGSIDATKIIASSTNTLHRWYQPLGNLSGVFRIFVIAKQAEYPRIGLLEGNSTRYNAVFDLSTGTIAANPVGTDSRITPLGNGWYLCEGTTINASNQPLEISLHPLRSGDTSSLTIFTGDDTSGVFVYAAGFGALGSLIPTTTVSVTRAADILNVDGARFSQFYNPSQGTLLMELTPIASAVGAVAGSLNDGTLNNAIRIQQKQSGTLSSIRKIATDGQTDVMGINASTGNTLRSNGVDYTEVSDQSAQTKFGVASSGVGNFLNVGGTENFRSSADSGQTYNARTIGGSFVKPHYGLGRFVVANNTSTIGGATVGSVIVSPDGLALRRVNIPGLTQQLQDVTSNTTNGSDGSLLVVVGNSGVIYTSADSGETWTARTSGVATTFNGAAYGLNGATPTFVAVNNTAANSRYSVDGGVTWSAVTGLTGTITDICHTGSQFVAINTVGGVFTSADGIAFAVVTTSGITPAFTTALGVTFANIGGNGYYVIAGNGGQWAVSQTAANASPTTWTTYTNGGTPSTLNGGILPSVTAFNNKFYACSQSNNVIIEFDPVAVAFASRAGNVTSPFNGITASPTRVLVCGPSGAITTSEDGTTFTSRTGNGTQLNGAAFGNGTYVVVGNAVNGSGLIATVNPTTFAYQRRVSGTTNTINDVAFLNGAFYAPHTAGIQRSTDGITYTSQTVGGTSFAINRVAYDGTRHIAVGAGGRYTLSTDNGLTWAASALNGVTTQNLNGLASFGGLTVACGNVGTIITTTNGTTWALRTSGTTANLFSVMYSARDSRWYAAGDNGVILRSPDAMTWTSIANEVVSAVLNTNTVQANPALTKFNLNTVNRIATRLQFNNFGVSVNANPVVTDPSLILPNPDRLSIGMNGVNGQHFNGWIRKIDYYPVAKSDTELRNLCLQPGETLTTAAEDFAIDYVNNTTTTVVK